MSVFAVHKTKLLEERLWNVSAMGDIVEVTEEILRRIEFVESAVPTAP
ncbi:hypothetical protein [uncultured Paraglaciecola sp.]|nr:hypothetical protein [uncultured Paraglaciecola sp.]